MHRRQGRQATLLTTISDIISNFLDAKALVLGPRSRKTQAIADRQRKASLPLTYCGFWNLGYERDSTLIGSISTYEVPRARYW